MADLPFGIDGGGWVNPFSQLAGGNTLKKERGRENNKNLFKGKRCAEASRRKGKS